MNIFESLFINTVFILFPLFCYLLFVAHQRACGKKTNKIIYDVAIYTSLYLTLKYGTINMGISIMLIFIPLLIAYLKRDILTAIIISLVIGIYYHFDFRIDSLLIISEFMTYLIIFFIFFKNKNRDAIIINIFTIVKILFALIEAYYSFFKDFNLFCILVLVGSFYLMVKLVCYLLKKGEESSELGMAVRELEKQKQLRDSLFKITHEIKNPLAVSKGYLDMLDTNNKSQVERYIPIIKQEIDRTLTLMNDFLNLTKLKVEKSHIDVSVVLNDICESLEILIKSNNIAFNYDVFDDEVYLLGDYDRLKQVFINLIKNAIESIPKGRKGVIELRTKKTNNNVVVTIEDNGIGISKEVLNKLGEPFFTTKKGGTGLGIRFSKEIIEAHEGTITYKSEQKKGTTVKIILPTLKNPK
jgi:two-component system sporulation sensor kinase B